MNTLPEQLRKHADEWPTVYTADRENRKILVEAAERIERLASENATLRKLGTATRDAASHIGWTSCETGSVITMAERAVKEWDEYVHSINNSIHEHTTN